VKADASGEFSETEMSGAIAIKYPALAFGLSGCGLLSVHFAIFGGEDIEVAIAIDVGQRQRMPVDDVSANEVVADP